MSKLYSYWEGDSRHWFYDLCWSTVLQHNPEAVILSQEDVIDVIGDLPLSVKEAYVTHRCDWIRKKFIHTVGGAWLDMDFICFKPLDFLVKQSEVFDYVGYKEWSGGWMDNFFSGRKDSIILKSAADHALENITTYGRNISWLGASTDSLNHAFSKYPWALYCQLPTHIVTPFSVNDPDNFLSYRHPSDAINHASLGFMASMHTLNGFFNQQDCFKSIKSAECLVNSATNIGSILRRAFGMVV